MDDSRRIEVPEGRRDLSIKPPTAGKSARFPKFFCYRSKPEQAKAGRRGDNHDGKCPAHDFSGVVSIKFCKWGGAYGLIILPSR
jgi:hypothetical protein